jgi:putative membrane-bound dehydrogenase-like protein
LSLKAEPALEAKDLPRVSPTEPAKAVDTFEIKKGFKLELAACEPLVASPVAIAFDERGRIFVVEMRDYPDRRDDRMGRVRVLEDTNGDGVYDKATVYADGLPWPTGICCYDGGVFVVASPDILYLKDTKADNVADVRKVVFTGFGAGLPPAKLNVQGLPNSLTWGPDNRIHGATSSNGGRVARADGPTTHPLELHGLDFSFDPRTLDIRAESGGGQHGMSFSTSSQKFVCSNSHHLQAILYDAPRYAGRNPLYAMPSPLVDIAVDGPAAEVYRASPDEAWRVIRTKWRVAGLASGPIEGGGRPSGYFSGATGVTLYTGNSFPSDFLDNGFVADCGGNLVHRKIIRPDGVSFIAERPPGEQKTEFLRSRDIWFRPVSLANGPDGALYVIDMYREVIEHPWSLPDSIKQHLDLHSGVDRGRIWRIVPEGFKRPATPRLDRATTAELVALLEHPNDWHRETAARLLYERRKDAELAPMLAKLLVESKSPSARLQALGLLDALGALDESQIVTAMRDEDEAVRVCSIQLSERILREGSASQPLWGRLAQLAAGGSSRVGFQLALSLSAAQDPRKVPLLWTLGRRQPSDPWLRSAVLNAAAGHEKDLLYQKYGKLTAAAATAPDHGTMALLCELTVLIGAGGRDDDVHYALGVLSAQRPDPPTCFALANALASGLQRSSRAAELRAASRPFLQPILSDAAGAAMNPQVSEATRVQAIGLLGAAGSAAESSPRLLSLLGAAEPQSVQSAAIAALDHLDDGSMAEELLKRLPALSPRTRSEAVTVLLKRPARAAALLGAMESGSLRPDAISPTQALALKAHRDPTVKELSRKVFGPGPTKKRDDVIADFLPALDLAGRPAQGRELYRHRCISCHRSGGEGSAVGPDFVTLKTAGKEKNLVNILDPNREVAPQYISYIVETKSGDTLTGIIAAETGASLTVRQPFGVETVVLRADLKRIQSQNLSLMPEGIETGMTKQDMADLLEYIATAEK